MNCAGCGHSSTTLSKCRSKGVVYRNGMIKVKSGRVSLSRCLPVSLQRKADMKRRRPASGHTMSNTEVEVTIYERIGGADTIDRLVESFYRRMDTLEEARTIRAMHAANLAPIKQVLKNYLSEWTGGPKLYSVTRGHPRLRQRHLGFPIAAAERDAWTLCMRGALDETVADTATRAKLDAALSGLADWMRNRESS
jgi:hemoglobin